MERWSIADWFGVVIMVGIASIYIAWCWLQDRVIRGDIHWNESSGEAYRRLESGIVCRCRACKRIKA